MKAMVLHEFGQPLVAEELPVREPVGSEVLLKVLAAGVCGTDLKIARGRNRNARLPRVLGHEFAGEVVAVGPAARGRKVGDRGAVYFYLTCGLCPYCLSGRENLCQSRQGFFGFDRDGGFAEYCLVPEGNLVPVPEGVSMEEAAIVSDAVGTSWHAARTVANLRPGQTAVVIGLGGLGLHGVQAAAVCGATVIAVDSVPAKLEAARGCGARFAVNSAEGDYTQTVQEIVGGKGVDAVLEYRGKLETIEPAYRCLRPGGALVMVSYVDGGASMSVPQRAIFSTELRITAARGNTRLELAEVLRLTADGRLRPIVSGTMRLDQVNEAIDTLGTGGVTGRIVLVP